MSRIRSRLSVFVPIVLAVVAGPVLAGSHTWDVNEVFSNADGSIQFIELKETAGGASETFLAGHVVDSLTKSFTMTNNVVGPTSFRHVLLATASFAALPGAPAPDYIIPANFFTVTGDRIRYNPWDSWTFGAVPTNGLQSLNRTGGALANSPTNYAGATGSVDANPPPAPPGVPDGSGGSQAMTVEALDATGTALRITYDTATCSSGAAHHILYGEGLQFPASPGSAFALTGAVCSIGGSPYTWDPSPAPADSTGIIWFVIVRGEGAAEGSWGTDSAGAERLGPGAGGSSGQCSVTGRSLTNACGH